MTDYVETPSDGVAVGDGRDIDGFRLGDRFIGVDFAAVLGPTEALSLSDQISRVWQAYSIIADGLSLSDPLALAFVKALTDQIEMGDGRELGDFRVGDRFIGVNFAIGLGHSDGISLADALAQQAVGLNKVDGLALSDADSHVWEAFLSVADSLSVSDAAALTVVKAIVSGLSLSDAAALSFVKSLTDGVSLADAAALTVVKAMADAIAISETVTSRTAIYWSLAARGSGRRQIVQGVQWQGEDEETKYGLDTLAWGGFPTNVSLVVKAWSEISTPTDVTDDVTDADPEVGGNVIWLPAIKSLTVGQTYRVELKFTSQGQVFEAFAYIEAEV